MFHKIKLILSSVKKRGFINTINIVISEILFDKVNRIDTSDVIKLDSITIKSKNIKDGIEYCPSNEFILDRIFKFIDKSYDLQNSILLDYGCGKGRVLLFAERFKFRKIIGVEFAQELYQIAKHNITKLGFSNIEIYHEDATKFRIPNNVNIFYLYNPFVGDTMQKVINNIEKYKNSYKIELLIIYVNPICKDMFINMGGYKVIYEYKDEVIIFER